MNERRNRYFMEKALKLAKVSADLGEVPVGAVVVINDDVVGVGFNRRELLASPVEHAELSAIRQAAKNLGRWRLLGATVYSTLEPCIMCAGALVHARISGLFYGAADPKFGGIESLYHISEDHRLNHQFQAKGGLMADESALLLKEFFKGLRGT